MPETRIPVPIDEEMKKQFHRLCIDADVSMAEALRAYIAEVLAEASSDPHYVAKWKEKVKRLS